MRALFFLVLVAGIGNTVLRPELENPYTLYRVVAPLLLMVIAVRAPVYVLKCLLWFSVFVGYNFILASLYSSNYSEFLPSIVHYLYIFILFIAILHMRATDRGFDLAFLKFIDGFFIFILINLLVEYLVGP